MKRRVEAKIPLPGNGRGAPLEADGFIACNTCSVEPEAISRIRENYRLDDSDTVAAGRTDIPGLESDLFEGLSRTRRQEVGLRSLDGIYGEDRPIQSPNRNAQASRHAEEDIFNSIANKIDSLGLSQNSLNGRTVVIDISNSTGICTTCWQGFINPGVPSGVVKQFSQRYPGLTLRITASGADVRPGLKEVVVRGGQIVD